MISHKSAGTFATFPSRHARGTRICSNSTQFLGNSLSMVTSDFYMRRQPGAVVTFWMENQSTLIYEEAVLRMMPNIGEVSQSASVSNLHISKRLANQNVAHFTPPTRSSRRSANVGPRATVAYPIQNSSATVHTAYTAHSQPEVCYEARWTDTVAPG